MKNRIGLFFLILILASAICACGARINNNSERQANSSKEYHLTRFLGSYEEMESFMEEALKNDFCNKIYLNEDETILTIEATEKQREKWVESAVTKIEDAVKGVPLADGFTVDLNPEYTECLIHASGNRNIKSMTQTCMVILMEAEIYQVFNGIENWSVKYVIVDSDIGEEILNVDFPKESIDYSADMWRYDSESN